MSRPEPRFGLHGDREGPPGFGRAGALGGVAILAVVVAGLVYSAMAGRPAAAQKPAFFGGSLVLEDSRPPTVIDVATAQITVRLEGVDSQVGATNYSDVQAVPLQGGTMLVNDRTGSFNFLEKDNYVADPNGPGVGLGALIGATAAEGIATGSDAYILRSAPNSTVSLVGPQTVHAAARVQSSGPAEPGSVAPLGFDRLGGPVSTRPGSVAVAGGDLWALVGSGARCSAVRLHPDATSSQGLVPSSPVTETSACGAAALEAAGGLLGLADPGRIRMLEGASPGAEQVIEVPFTEAATNFVPVTGVAGQLWFLAHTPASWTLFGVEGSGRLIGPYPLAGFGSAADPVLPAYSNGFLYTLDQDAPGQPTLWAIDVTNGHMAPVRDAPTYPARTSTERASFQGAEVLVDGPRVVFNNPQSLDAVVLFTDGTRSPVVIDKSQAVALSTTGPADLDLSTPTTVRGAVPTPAPSHSLPVQAVSQQVTCADTTQKPYAPQVTSVSVSSSTALIDWSYELLDQTDCEPSSWALHVTALTGDHQPAQPIQVVDGQNQYLFAGLRPATTYAATVTAYINTQSTVSSAVTFTTSPRGPDAPLSVSTTSDGKGDWIVSWVPCTEADHPTCVVPADEWTIVGAACAGSYVPTPPVVQVPGSQDSVTINAANLNLLGDSLSFTVQGSLTSGLTGSPTSDQTCDEAWQPADPGVLTLGATGQLDGDAIKAVLSVTASGNPLIAFGVLPSETEFVYHVGGESVGPTSDQSVTVTGLAAGQQYMPTVDVYPAGHPEAAVTLTGQLFSQTLPWPSDLEHPIVTPAVDPIDPNAGAVTVAFPADLPALDLAVSGSLTCGSWQTPLPAQLASGTVSVQMNLDTNGGSCSVSLTLDDRATPDPYGGPSPELTTSFTIGTQPGYTFTDQFTSQYGQLEVDSTDAGTLVGDDWTVATSSDSHGGGADQCAISQALPTPPTFPVDISLPSTCADPHRVSVTVSYQYLGQNLSPDAGAPEGTAPTTTTTTTTSTTTPASSTTTTTSSSTPAAGASLGWIACLFLLIWPGAPLARWARRHKERSEP